MATGTCNNCGKNKPLYECKSCGKQQCASCSSSYGANNQCPCGGSLKTVNSH